MKDSFTPWFLSIPVHIIPARAPTGVKNAPKFEPITDAYTAPTFSPTKAENNTLIGILLIKLEQRNELIPHLIMLSSSVKNVLISLVAPVFTKASTKVNIEITKGTVITGALRKDSPIYISFFLKAQYTKEHVYWLKKHTADTIHMGMFITEENAINSMQTPR